MRGRENFIDGDNAAGYCCQPWYAAGTNTKAIGTDQGASETGILGPVYEIRAIVP